MSWRDEYETAKTALNKLYDDAATERERDLIEAKQFELIQANMLFVIEQMKAHAFRMRILISSLEAVIKPNAAGKITGAAKSLAQVLDLWRTAIKGTLAGGTGEPGGGT